MSFLLQVYDRMSARIDGRQVQSGSLERPRSITVDGEVHERTDTIANAANAVFYNDELGGFEFLAVRSDFNTRALITDTAGNTFSITVRGSGTANKYGVGIQLPSDKTADANTRINSVQLFNTSGSSAKASIIVIN